MGGAGGTCCVVGCANYTSPKNPGVSFHAFPRNTALRRKWVASIGRKNWHPSQRSAVCSDHFRPECFRFVKESSKLGKPVCRRRLKSVAVPTLFACNRPASLPYRVETVKMKRSAHWALSSFAKDHNYYKVLVGYVATQTDDMAHCAAVQVNLGQKTLSTQTTQTEENRDPGRERRKHKLKRGRVKAVH